MPSGTGQLAFALRAMTTLVSESAAVGKRQSLTALSSTFRARDPLPSLEVRE